MAFKLSIEQGKGRGQAFDFDTAAITIGRAEENDVVLYDEQGVSRRHARVSLVDGKYFIEDLDSANGTLLNGARVKKEALAEGDTIGIGSVVFRFGTGKASATREDGSTRIVQLSKTNPRAEMPTKPAPSANAAPAPAAPAAGAPNPLNVRIVAGAVAVLAVLAVVFVLVSYKASNRDARGSCVNPMRYDDRAPLLVFGNVNEAVCAATKRVAFSFKPNTKSRVIVTYAPFYTEPNELKVLVNDKVVETVPAATTRQSRRRTLVLSESQVNENKENIISFVADGGGEWGIEHFELQVVGQDESNQKLADDSYQLGKRYIEQRYVASANLYKGWLEFRKARRAMEWLDPKPATYKTVVDQIDKAEQELDKLCKDRLFSANKEARYGRIEEANERYQFILAAFPGDEHPCRTEAQQHIGSLVAQQQQSSGGGLQ